MDVVSGHNRIMVMHKLRRHVHGQDGNIFMLKPLLRLLHFLSLTIQWSSRDLWTTRNCSYHLMHVIKVSSVCVALANVIARGAGQ